MTYGMTTTFRVYGAGQGDGYALPSERGLSPAMKAARRDQKTASLKDRRAKPEGQYAKPSGPRRFSWE